MSNQTKTLKDLSQFLMDADLVKELADHHMDLIQNTYPRLIEKLAPDNEQRANLFYRSTWQFMHDLQSGKIADHIVDTFDRWKEANDPGGIDPTDIILLYTLRKQTFMHFAHRYTADASVILKIGEELDALLLIVQKTGIKYNEEFKRAFCALK